MEKEADPPHTKTPETYTFPAHRSRGAFRNTGPTILQYFCKVNRRFCAIFEKLLHYFHFLSYLIGGKSQKALGDARP
jgi:hypothetical protein